MGRIGPDKRKLTFLPLEYAFLGSRFLELETNPCAKDGEEAGVSSLIRGKNGAAMTDYRGVLERTDFYSTEPLPVAIPCASAAYAC